MAIFNLCFFNLFVFVLFFTNKQFRGVKKKNKKAKQIKTEQIFLPSTSSHYNTQTCSHLLLVSVIHKILAA